MKVQEQNRLYIFDGTWFVEKLDDKKIFNKRQIAPPPKEGEQRANPLADGTGPFVLPLNLKKKDIKSRFTVKVIKASKRDPENSIHLRLTPRPPRRIDFEQIDLWYSKESLLPLRVETVDDAENESVINISKHKVNSEIDLKKVDVKEPKERGWKITVTPWEEK